MLNVERWAKQMKSGWSMDAKKRISWPNWSGKWNQNSAPQFQRKFRAIMQRLDSASLEYICQCCVPMWCGRHSWSWSNRFPSPSSLDSMSPVKISKHFSNFLTHWSSHVGHFWPMKFKKRPEAWRRDSEKNILIWWEESWNQAPSPWPLLPRCDFERTMATVAATVLWSLRLQTTSQEMKD